MGRESLSLRAKRVMFDGIVILIILYGFEVWPLDENVHKKWVCSK